MGDDRLIRKRLTKKQRVFCIEYIKTNNGRQSAIAAGYSRLSSDSRASQLLNNDKVKAYIQDFHRKQAKRLEISQDKILQEIAATAFVNVADCFTETGELRNISEMPEETQKALDVLECSQIMNSAGDQAVTAKIKIQNKLKALELLGNNLSMWKEDEPRERAEIRLKISFV